METVNTKEATKFLQCSNKTLYRLISEGHIPYARVGRGYVFRKPDLEAYLDKIIKRTPDIRLTGSMTTK